MTHNVYYTNAAVENEDTNREVQDPDNDDEPITDEVNNAQDDKREPLYATSSKKSVKKE